MLRNNHGSVLLMVIGVLTMIAILGSAFILVSHADAQQSAALADKSQVEPLARNIVARLGARMMDDLYYDPGSTFGATTGIATAKAYAPVTGTFSVDPNYGPFRNLATAPNNGPVGWLGYVDSNADVCGWMTTPFFDGNTCDLRQTVDVDVDGDGVVDANAPLCNTGIKNTKGDANYYIAARVYDLSAMLNINVASNISATDSIVTARCPSFIRLDTLFTPTPDAGIRSARIGTGTSESQYIQQCARNPLQPLSAIYRPFMIADEAYLRWHKAGSALEAGPLGVACIGSALTTDSTNRNYLTTFNANSTLRRGSFGFSDINTRSSTTWFLNKVAVEYGSTANSDAKYNEIYRQAFMMLNELVVGNTGAAVFPSMRQQMAACFTANLMTGDPSLKPADTTIPAATYKFTPKSNLLTYASGGATDTVVAYGTVADLCITKVYAAHYVVNPNIIVLSGAVELYNPPASANGTTRNLAGYQLRFTTDATENVSTITLPSVTVSPGQRVVVFSARKNTAGTWNTATLTEGGLPSTTADPGCRLGGTTTATCHTNALNFTNGGLAGQAPTWMLRLTPVADPQYTLDSINGTDLGYNTMDNTRATTVNCNPSVTRMYYRDWTPAHQRYMNPNYLTLGASGCGVTNMGLALPTIDSNLASSGLRLGPYPVNDLGDLMSIPWAAACVRTGTWQGKATLTSFGTMMQNTALASNNMYGTTLSGRGRLDPLPTNVNYGGYAPAIGTKYPDVPAACLFTDFFTNPVDTTRDGSQQYGKINVNTAPQKVLAQLPLGGTLPFPTAYTGNAAVVATSTDAVNCIIAYRDKSSATVTTAKGSKVINFSTRSTVAGMNIAGLRNTNALGSSTSNTVGFLSEGEVAIPLAMYCHTMLTDAFSNGGDTLMTLATHPDYIYARDYLYRSISNMITVRSDVYAINIRVQLGKGNNVPTWYYVAVVDRSNCRTLSDMPRVLLFTQVK